MTDLPGGSGVGGGVRLRPRNGLRGAMLDAILIVSTVAFFALACLYVIACERM